MRRIAETVKDPHAARPSSALRAPGAERARSQEFWCQKIDYRPLGDTYHLRRAYIDQGASRRHFVEEAPRRAPLKADRGPAGARRGAAGSRHSRRR